VSLYRRAVADSSTVVPSKWLKLAFISD
jgi:hypothetical protein